MNPEGILESLKTAQAQYRNSTSDTTSSERQETLAEWDLGGVDCPRCGNTGRIIRQGPALLELHVYECPCMRRRRSLRSLRKAGMEDMAKRYTMETYQTDTPSREKIKASAAAFVESDSGWFFIAGRSGSGKTHICTAICNGLMERHSEILFMPWRDESTVIKNGITDREWYETRVKRLKRVPVLYIDDFLKGGASDADKRLAFEVLNSRYNDTSMRTVISSEMSLTEIMAWDEAIGGRIYERSRGFVVKAPDENWRLKNEKR